MIRLAVRILFVATLLAPVSASAADQPQVQFCWAMGMHDNTIYYAEADDREDRLASFDTLLEISGIDHHPVKCTTSDSTAHRLARTKLMEDWLEFEFEMVNTTFLSDLDY